MVVVKEAEIDFKIDEGELGHTFLLGGINSLSKYFSFSITHC